MFNVHDKIKMWVNEELEIIFDTLEMGNDWQFSPFETSREAWIDMAGDINVND